MAEQKTRAEGWYDPTYAPPLTDFQTAAAPLPAVETNVGMTNPMTTTGDVIYSSSGASPARLAVGSASQVLAVSGGLPAWSTFATLFTSLVPYAMVRSQFTSGTAGGTLTATTWVTRPLNNEVSDAGSILSLSSNQVTLSAGTYRCLISGCGFHQAGASIGSRLYNVTDTATVLNGSNGYAVDSQWQYVIAGQFTIAASKALEVQHYATATRATDGMGVAVTSGEIEVYTIAEFWKVA